MALEIEINCGTNNRKKFLIDLEEYGAKETVGSTPSNQALAIHIMINSMNERFFIDDGHRNQDAVNTSIALHVLGFDPEEWFKNFFTVIEEEHPDMFYGTDIVKFYKHLERVHPYLDSWGPEGNEGEALRYAL